MDAKITLSFNAEVIEKAKAFAESQNISLSRLTEMMFDNMTKKNYRSIAELPIADWVYELAEGRAEYKKQSSSKEMKEEFFESRKKK